MCVAQAAKRRRAQAANKYRHMAPLRRPRYVTRSLDVSQRRLQRQLDKLKVMQQRKKK